MHYNTHTNNNSVKFIKVSAEILSSNMSTRLGQLMLLCRSIPRSGLHTANVIIHQIAIFFKIHKCLVHDSNMSCAGRKEWGTFDTYLSYRAYYTSHTSIHFRITWELLSPQEKEPYSHVMLYICEFLPAVTTWGSAIRWEIWDVLLSLRVWVQVHRSPDPSLVDNEASLCLLHPTLSAKRIQDIDDAS